MTEIFEKVRRVVEANFEKPLLLQEDPVKSMWEATRNYARIAAECKGLFGSLLNVFHDEKGSDRLPKLLSKWVVATGNVINNDGQELTPRLRELCLMLVNSEELNSVATSFANKLTTCIVTAVREAFWDFVYSEKVTEEELAEEQSQPRQDRQQVQQEDLISVYRLGSSALFRIKKVSWKKLKFRPRKSQRTILQETLKIVDSLEEKDTNEIPRSINRQNRNLRILVMKKELVPPLGEFTKRFGEVVNFHGYKTYGNNLFKVAKSQILCNLDVKSQLLHCLTKARPAAAKERKTVLNSFFREFIRKLFNIKCKAFLKSLEILEEEKQGKSLQRDTMLRAKLKVCGLDSKVKK